MKKLAIMMVAGAGLLSFNTAKAQLGFHINLNFGNVPVRTVYSQPAQVAYSDYSNNDDYYYMPDVEAYYSVPQHCYYYNDGNRWIAAANLPGRYHDFDWRTARHYEIRGDRPFMHHDMYRTRYGGSEQRGGSFADNRYDNRGGFDSNQGRFEGQRGGDNRGFDRASGGYDQYRSNDNWGRQFQGGQFDNQDRRARGQYQQQGNDQNQNRGNYGQNQNGNQYQNGGNQGRGGFNQQPSNNGSGQFQNGNTGRGNGGQQPSNNNGGQNAQPSNQNGGRDRSGANGNDHFTANRMGMTRPERL